MFLIGSKYTCFTIYVGVTTQRVSSTTEGTTSQTLVISTSVVVSIVGIMALILAVIAICFCKCSHQKAYIINTNQSQQQSNSTVNNEGLQQIETDSETINTDTEDSGSIITSIEIKERNRHYKDGCV